MRLARVVVVAAMMLALAGSAVALPRDGEKRGRNRDEGIVKMVKRIVRALGDGLTVPLPKPLP